MIVLSDIVVRFGDRVALQGISASLPDEGAVALRGVSGAGKTTLLRVLAGLLQPDAGSVSGLAGRRISMVFQEDRLLPWRTALQNVSLVSNEARARELLMQLDLADALALRRPRFPEGCGGGWRLRALLPIRMTYCCSMSLSTALTRRAGNRRRP